MKKALITGVTGQDGSYLAKLLLDKEYEVYGAVRRTPDRNLNGLKYLGINKKIKYLPLELLEFTNIYKTIKKIKPDEIYNLGAQSFVARSFEEPIFSADVTALGPLRVLEAIRAVNTNIKFYQASSSEMFGKAQTTPQSEKTSFYPRSPYAASKLFAHWITVNYRETCGIFACSGILFNHESPLRGLEFVTRKITRSVAQIKLGISCGLKIGNLDAKRDWGYAPEYVEAMWLMLQHDKPDDYVIASGETHSVREFADLAFKMGEFDIEWQGTGVEERGIDKRTGKTLIGVSPEYFRPGEVNNPLGDYSKAKRKLGWQPKTKFEGLVRLMVEADMREVERSLKQK
jgi:GDPmannose 4,6-dehydratase